MLMPSDESIDDLCQALGLAGEQVMKLEVHLEIEPLEPVRLVYRAEVLAHEGQVRILSNVAEAALDDDDEDRRNGTKRH